MKTPDYVLIERVKIMDAFMSETVFEAGTFVRPIDDIYLPKHIKESKEYYWHNKAKEVFCYTPQGIRAIPKDKMRKV